MPKKKSAKIEYKSQEILEDIFDNVTVGIIGANPKTGKFLFTNKYMSKLTGYSEKELKKMNVERIHPKEYLKEITSVFKKQASGKLDKAEALPIVKKNKKIIYCDVRSVIKKIGDEKVILGMFSEVTDRRLAKKKLDEQKEKFKLIFDDINDAVYLHTIEGKGIRGRFVEVNKVATEMLGYSRDEFLKMNPKKIDDAKVAKKIIPGAAKKLKMKGNAIFEMVHVAKDGTKIPVELNSSLVDYQGEKLILTVARDITEKKKNEQDIERMFNFSNYMVCKADLKTGRFTKISPAFTKILGWSEKELLSKPFTEFIHIDDKEKTNKVVAEQIKEGKEVLKFENRYRTKKGDYRWFEWASHPVPEEGVSYSAAYDITERKKIADKIKEQEKNIVSM